MADRSKLEQMLECLVNGEQAKAEELFHEYVVAQSRDIYESLIESELQDDEEEDVEEGMEVTFRETDDEEVDPTDDLAGEIDGGAEGEMGGEEGEGEFGGEESEEEIMQDLGAIIDELQAKFDALTGEEEEQGEFGDEEGEEGEFGGEEGGEEEEMVDNMDLETVREYVEKVGTDWDKNGLRKEGEYSGTGSQSDSISINSKSTVAGKNDMGGTSANIAKSGTEKSPVEANKGQLRGNGLLKGNVVPNPDAKGNVNVPGGNAGKTGFKHKEPGHGAEKKGPAEGQFSGKGGSAGTVDKASLFRGRR